MRTATAFIALTFLGCSLFAQTNTSNSKRSKSLSVFNVSTFDKFNSQNSEASKFTLSGFEIAYATERKDGSLLEFASDRIRFLKGRSTVQQIGAGGQISENEYNSTQGSLGLLISYNYPLRLWNEDSKWGLYAGAGLGSTLGFVNFNSTEDGRLSSTQFTSDFSLTVQPRVRFAFNERLALEMLPIYRPLRWKWRKQINGNPTIQILNPDNDPFVFEKFPSALEVRVGLRVTL